MCGMADVSAVYESFSNQFLRHQPWPLLFISAYYSTALPNSSPSSFPSTVVTAASIIFSTFCVTSTCSFSFVTLTYLIPYLLPTYLDNSHPLFLWSLLSFPSQLYFHHCCLNPVPLNLLPTQFILYSSAILIQLLFPSFTHFLCLICYSQHSLFSSCTVYLLPSYLSCISFFWNLR